MISINTSFIRTVKMTDPSTVVSTCSLGVSNLGTGLSGIRAVRPASSVSLAVLPVRERNERPTQALEAAVVAEAHAYAFAAAGAGSLKQTQQQHTMWAFRGPEPWSDPA
ncbi:hypothetical protein ACFWA4_33985 [Streptomyces sp. NPDC060011]|uniref:hypothetical protein n=1 Tax=unclassified Streptomyces TaxID=2593676 RepID=UPI0009C14EA9|nr:MULTISPECIES: hypothetical protein [unclassified Streptomyces]NEB30903.1 hypothetical protein [Streptomyces sp. SID14446]MCX4916888.1 hypothetical protein [Streptomyces sp. NBC_00687]MCX5131008.1 hypothetical protein [Streptomyces sp. NBC_00340]MCX5278978.1 hypothetical protein [Streptomyces sp. NBC_00198]OQQ18227.1 hypothetical protein B0675_14855 [Streptomyces sp. M41(2017)]